MATNFPKTEIYCLSSQLQRAAVSVPANIAEGRQRQHSKEFLQHLSIAHGFLAELETHIQIAGRLNYIYEDQINKILGITAEIGKMLNGLRSSIEKKVNPEPRHPTPDLCYPKVICDLISTNTTMWYQKLPFIIY